MFEQLKYFLILAKKLNYSESAFEINISQSSLSKQIKALERDLRVELVDRSKRKVKLTDAGVELLPIIERTITDYEELLSEAKSHSKFGQKLSIGTIPLMPKYQIADMIMAFAKSSPNITIQLFEDGAMETWDRVVHHKVDVGILRMDQITDENCIQYPILDDELVIVTSPKHRLAKQKKIKLSEIKDEPIYMFGIDTQMQSVCIDFCIGEGFYPKVDKSFLRIGTIKTFVRKSEGIAMLLKNMVDDVADKDLSIVEIENSKHFPIVISVQKGAFSPTTEKFMEFAKSFYK
ncbi:MAG: LysR family transcriptional regulator [Flexilinea sp.]